MIRATLMIACTLGTTAFGTLGTLGSQRIEAPARFQVLLETTKGAIRIECIRAWAPHGADRFYELVTTGYYDDSAFFRIRPNTRGTVAFAFAVPNGRATQVFINLADNRATHDKEPFVPFGRVTEGLEVADSLYREYGEAAGGGIRAGKQAPLFEQGNAYLTQHFPKLDYIKTARVVR